MLRIWRVSGEELVALPLDQLTDVSTLKKQLRAKEGMPCSFVQLLHDGHRLPDAFELKQPMDVQLALSTPTEGLDADCSDDFVELAIGGAVEALRWLLEAGVDKDSTDCFGRTALTQAAAAGQLNAVRFLLDAGAGIDLRDQESQTALMRAAGAGQVEVARFLLEAGAGMDVTDELGQTALMWASVSGQVNTGSLLLEAGVKMDLMRDEGLTALMLASAAGHVDIVRLLLDAGAKKDWTSLEPIFLGCSYRGLQEP